jgi:hypothetical protein
MWPIQLAFRLIIYFMQDVPVLQNYSTCRNILFF